MKTTYAINSNKKAEGKDEHVSEQSTISRDARCLFHVAFLLHD
jgi:hypothetical protein